MRAIDTNNLVACLRGKAPHVMHRLRMLRPSEVLIPCQVYAELLLGAAKSAKPVENKRAVLELLEPFRVLWPIPATVECYVSIRADLEQRGCPISEADLWIAASALQSEAILVTHNTREFSRVQGLKLEDWLETV